MALMILPFFLQVASAAPVEAVSWGVVWEFLMGVVRYLVGIAVVALAGANWRLIKDNITMKADIQTLQQQRKDDLNERNTALTTVQSVKNETSKLQSEFDMKIQNMNLAWTKQNNENMSVMKDMVSEIKITLEKMNGAFEIIKDRYEREKQ